MKLPNFFIVGAAKAGTSSIFRYMEQHPDIYFPRVKEPGYFAFAEADVNFQGPGDERLNNTVVTKLEDYLDLFGDVKSEKAIGEASVVYLHSVDAANRIKDMVPEAKIIVILRNPVDRALSSYAHKIRDGYEEVGVFMDAFSLGEERARLNWQHLWQYRDMSFYAEELERYFHAFPRENIAVYKYEELTNNPQKLLQNIFGFLEVDTSFVPEMSVRHNVSGRPKSRLIHRFFRGSSFFKDYLKPLFSENMRFKIRSYVMKKNVIKEKEHIGEKDIEYLKGIYSDDILKTQELIGKDLSGWL